MGESNATGINNFTLSTMLNDLKHNATNASNDNYMVGSYVDLLEQNVTAQRAWNFSKITAISDYPTISTDASSSTTCATTTTDSFDEFGPPEGIEYIFVPLGVVVFVIILSAVVWVLLISRKRKLERLRHRLMPMYNFDPGEEEEDDWETELLEECYYNSNQRRQGYQSMDTEENSELFGSR
ncbi:hypothetical protein KM043_006185 [Ampulex compressa]|nr:hypothetical protein KM043_006185 [Ampulex compressa]